MVTTCTLWLLALISHWLYSHVRLYQCLQRFMLQCTCKKKKKSSCFYCSEASRAQWEKLMYSLSCSKIIKFWQLECLFTIFCFFRNWYFTLNKYYREKCQALKRLIKPWTAEFKSAGISDVLRFPWKMPDVVGLHLLHLEKLGFIPYGWNHVSNIKGNSKAWCHWHLLKDGFGNMANLCAVF